MSDLPDLLALTSIDDGSSLVASPIRNNYSDIQTAVNGLISALSGGVAGQRFKADSTSAVEWAYDEGFFNVLDYGAVGDGVTSDLAAVQNAINAWLTAARGVLFFPAKDYLIDGTLTITPTVDQVKTLQICGYGARLLMNLPAQTNATVTVTIASPAVFTLTAHGFAAGDPVQFQTTGSLPTGLTAGTTYYVIASGLTANSFEVSTSVGGSAVNTSGTQSGTHTVYKGGAPGLLLQPHANTTWRNMTICGLQARVGSVFVSDAVKLTDGGGTQAFLEDFVIRDCSVESGVSGAVCNGLHVTGSSVGVFQYQIDNFQATMVSNVSGTGILVDGTAAGASSILITNPNITGFAYGIQMGTSGSPIAGGTIRDGTVLMAQNHGVRMYTHGGTIAGTHIENNWLSAGSLSNGGGGLYFEGWGLIDQLQDVRGTGSGFQRWAADVLASGGGYVTVNGRSTMPTKTIGTATITIASPAVITCNGHGLVAGDTVYFETTGALPTGLVADTFYYVISTGLTTNTFEVAATPGGSAINTSGSQSGTHTLFRPRAAVRIRAASSGTNVVTRGFAANEIDWSAVTVAGSPAVLIEDQVGIGSPNGTLAGHAPIGNLYRRLDGGAGTSMYVKESGTSNTGWVGK